MGQISTYLFGAVSCHVDVRLSGKRRGFDYESEVWTSIATNALYSSYVESLIHEVVQTAYDLDYGKIRHDECFAYLEMKPENQVMQLVRLEDAEKQVAAAWEAGESIRLRVQLWSDDTADVSINNGTLPSIARLKLINKNESANTAT